MANIRSINQPLMGGPENWNAMILQGIPRITPEEARNQCFSDMLQQLISPYFNKKSFTSFIMVFNTLVFISSCIYQSENGIFLKPSNDSLMLFGARESSKLKHSEIWRWITPVFLHASFNHFFINFVFIYAFVARVEFGVGKKLCIIMYFLTGFAGNLLGGVRDLGSNRIAVGSSTSIFGILGSMVGWTLLNWNSIGNNPAKLPSLIILLFIVFFNLLVGGLESTTDNFGHFGGFLLGITLALAIFEVVGAISDREKLIKKIGAGASGLYFISMLGWFYLY